MFVVAVWVDLRLVFLIETPLADPRFGEFEVLVVAERVDVRLVFLIEGSNVA